MMNLLEIDQRIKQRPPFQMIERVTELVPNESAKGIKCVSVNEPYFMGHFPETPIMPGSPAHRERGAALQPRYRPGRRRFR